VRRSDRSRAGWAWVLLGLSAVLVAGCGGSASTGLSDVGDFGSRSVPSGRPLTLALPLMNDSGSTVTLEHVRLVPLRGFATPELLAADTGTSNQTGEIVAGWPPTEAPGSLSGVDAVEPLRGARLRSGRYASVTMYLEIRAPERGDYGMAAVAVSVLKNGSPATIATPGQITMCAGAHPSVTLCPGYQAIWANGGDSYHAWLAQRRHPGLTPAERRLYAAFPVLRTKATITTSHRSVGSLESVPIGASLNARDTPLATSPSGYMNDDYSPTTVMTVLYHSAQQQIYAYLSYGRLEIRRVSRNDGTTSSFINGLYGNQFTTGGDDPTTTVGVLVPHWIRTVSVWPQNGRRFKLAVHNDIVTYTAARPFLITYPIGHRRHVAALADNYTGRLPPNPSL
jgi:hypothetical protein